jgi:hypothetical protein
LDGWSEFGDFEIVTWELKRLVIVSQPILRIFEFKLFLKLGK